MKARQLTAALFTSLFISTVGLHAQFTWTGNSPTDGNITDGLNWGGPAPTGSGGENVTFGSTLAQLNILVPTFSLNNISFSITHPAYSVSGTGSTPALTLGGNLTVIAGSTVTFNNTLGLTLATGVRTFDIGASTLLQMNSSVTGAGSLAKIGTGNLVLGGVNTYSGSTTVSFGTLQVNGGSITHASVNTVVGNANGDLATLSLINGGHVTNNIGLVGFAAGSTGTASVNGAGSTWTNNVNLVVGSLGSGSLTITNGGSATAAGGNVSIGAGAASAGIVNLSGTGSSLSAAASIIVGNAGQGQLTIDTGATASDATGNIGVSAGSTGTVTVDGTGSSWNNSNYLYVGAAGIGSLTIANSGTVNSTNTSIGNNTGGYGFLTVDGPGSTLTNLDTLYVGSQGSGNLLITGGGHAVDVTGSIGNNAGGTGMASVDGAGSVWTNTGDLHVGNATFGYLYASNGGLVTSANGYVATLPAAGAIASIDGTGTAWNLASSLYVGYQGSGVLVLNGNGVVNVANGTGTIHLGNSSGALGQIFIGDEGGPGGIVNAATITTGSGSGAVSFQTSTTSANPYYFTKDGTAAGTPVIIAGPTLVQVAGGYTVLAGNNTYTGGTYFAGGTLVAASNNALGTGPINFNNSGDTLNVASGVTINNPLVFGSGGKLAGNGTFGTAVSAGSGVILSPGNSPGTLSFSSGLTLASGGTLDFEVQSAAGPAGTGYDLVSVSGAALDITATSGSRFTLKLISLNAGGTAGNVADFSPASSYSWIVATSVAGINSFAANKFTIDTSAFSNGLGGGSFTLLQGVSGGNPALVLNFTAIPEPSTYALLVTGLALVGFGYRRRKYSSPRLARP